MLTNYINASSTSDLTLFHQYMVRISISTVYHYPVKVKAWHTNLASIRLYGIASRSIVGTFFWENLIEIIFDRIDWKQRIECTMEKSSAHVGMTRVKDRRIQVLSQNRSREQSPKSELLEESTPEVGIARGEQSSKFKPLEKSKKKHYRKVQRLCWHDHGHQRNESPLEWKNESMKVWKNERMKEWMNEQQMI